MSTARELYNQIPVEGATLSDVERVFNLARDRKRSFFMFDNKFDASRKGSGRGFGFDDGSELLFYHDGKVEARK